ncbi:hypothetical protein GCM10009789_82290 [Kribbella sancticallisti]|uniref:Peptidase inhibitor family I36 n=1 Tax=Kribbella sancticallisti TaxID=460087 RepID=A0ABN2ERV4_9ACTN
MSRTRLAALGAGVAIVGAGLTIAAPAQAASCYASSGKLYCGNTYDAPIYRLPRSTANDKPEPVIDRLRTTFSYFNCWTTGQQHAGGNNIWYQTVGDVTHSTGYIAARWVYTHTDPFPGVRPC